MCAGGEGFTHSHTSLHTHTLTPAAVVAAYRVPLPVSWTCYLPPALSSSYECTHEKLLSTHPSTDWEAPCPHTHTHTHTYEGDSPLLRL